jgi:glycerol uptake facilitator-like aquaporin
VERLPLTIRAFAEALGTGMLLTVVVGSGIMGADLADGNAALALLANSVATGAGLVVLITVLGPVSGAHFNPVVSLVERFRGALSTRDLATYVPAQLAGAMAGVMAAHAMFALPLVSLSGHVRSGLPQWWSEIVATFGLLLTVLGASRRTPERTPVLVGLYIVAAYWFTASTSFANPAVTLARAITDTFTGIRPQDTLPFITAQLIGGVLAFAVWQPMDSARRSSQS